MLHEVIKPKMAFTGVSDKVIKLVVKSTRVLITWYIAVGSTSLKLNLDKNKFSQVSYLLDVVPTRLEGIQADVFDRIFKVSKNLQNTYFD